MLPGRLAACGSVPTGQLGNRHRQYLSYMKGMGIQSSGDRPVPVGASADCCLPRKVCLHLAGDCFTRQLHKLQPDNPFHHVIYRMQ
jgi:hypothetical protein